jgi:hypothetical protein
MARVRCIPRKTAIAIGTLIWSIVLYDPSMCVLFVILIICSVHQLIYDHDRDAMGRCSECNNIDGCGFCLSSLQCLRGTETGPSSSQVIHGADCQSWTYLNTTCPGRSILFLLSWPIYLWLDSHYAVSYYSFVSCAQLWRLRGLFKLCVSRAMCLVCLREHLFNHFRCFLQRLQRNCVRNSLSYWLLIRYPVFMYVSMYVCMNEHSLSPLLHFK